MNRTCKCVGISEDKPNQAGQKDPGGWQGGRQAGGRGWSWPVRPGVPAEATDFILRVTEQGVEAWSEASDGESC